MSRRLACPFCGGAALHRQSHGWHGIGCQTDKCPAALHALMFRTADEAEATWNRRAVNTPESRDSQHVLKAEAARPDATDRENPGMASPDGGPMGVGQAAAAAPAGGQEVPRG